MEEQEQEDQLQEAGDQLQEAADKIQDAGESLTGTEFTEPLSKAAEWAETLGELALIYLPKIGMAILAVIIGFWMVKKIGKIVTAALERSGLSPEVSGFLSSFINALLKIIVLLFAASFVGIEVTAILGLLATAGIAIGLALQGSLSNFAAGLLIMIFKPYRVDDWVEIQDKFGKVEEVQIFNTIIVSPGQKTLIIPNGQVIEGVVTNYSQKGVVRMELEVTMPYSESFPKVKKIIERALNDIPEVLQDPEPEIGIINYDSHSIVVAIRPFVAPDDFWEVTFEAYRKVKEAFNREGIQVAYSEGVELGSIGD